MGTQKWGYKSSAAWLAQAGPSKWSRTFSGRPEAVELARDHAYSLFAGTGRETDVKLIVTELAANAVRHTLSGRPGGWFGLDLKVDTETAWIAVTDLGSDAFPVIKPRQDLTAADLDDPAKLATLAESGRGLQLVETLAIALGIHGSRNGRTVWADLDMKADAAARVRPSVPVFAC
ncbi:ATP-binding protein [Actinocorallia longicatena]|uniref:ATP-binding protein n=1 Tax=Actinocorallia longicatena TaxID=111803 RepID=A0ABP6QQE1_9ACTN